MQNDDKKRNALGNKQDDFAGTNPDRYGAPENADAQDNPIEDEEAQNVVDGNDRMADAETERARNKANEGKSED